MFLLYLIHIFLIAKTHYILIIKLLCSPHCNIWRRKRGHWSATKFQTSRRPTKLSLLITELCVFSYCIAAMFSLFLFLACQANCPGPTLMFFLATTALFRPLLIGSPHLFATIYKFMTEIYMPVLVKSAMVAKAFSSSSSAYYVVVLLLHILLRLATTTRN